MIRYECVLLYRMNTSVVKCYEVFGREVFPFSCLRNYNLVDTLLYICITCKSLELSSLPLSPFRLWAATFELHLAFGQRFAVLATLRKFCRSEQNIGL